MHTLRMTTIVAGSLALTWAASLGSACAQTGAQLTSAASRATHHVRHRLHAVAAGVQPRRAGGVAYRGLTINKPFGDERDGDQGYADDTDRVRYNDIHTFVPNPYTDSGQQFPFGLDGIGGYGSDLGFEAGQDSALYKRGP